MKNKQENLEIVHRHNHPQVQTSTNHVDDRWTEFKIIGKNIQSRSHHVTVIYKDCLYVQGGYDADKGLLSDFQKMDLSTKQQGFRWEPLQTNVPNFPGKLKSHTAVVYKDNLVIFGGQTIQLQNTNLTWIYNFTSQEWSTLVPDTNVPRLDSHKAVVKGNWMYVYGGFIDNQACYFSSIYKLDLNTWKWEKIDCQKNKSYPEARGSTGLVQLNNSLWIFGGTNGKQTLNDMWMFDLASSEWKQVKSLNNPQPRRSHSLVVSNEVFWMFGGIQDVTKQRNDIHIFNPQTSQWTRIMNSSNLVYECSPTMKLQTRNAIKRKDSPKKDSKRSLGVSPVYQQEKPDKGEGMKRILEENRQRKFQEKKNQLLKNFVQKSTQKRKRNVSPTSESMMKTLEVIGDQQHTKRAFHSQISYDPTMKFIVGKKPCARDAHSSIVYNGKMMIFGGDRHLMSFSDLYFFDLGKGLESRQVYNKQNKSRELS